MRRPTTAYFRARMELRPEIAFAFVERVLANPYKIRWQADGRARIWGYIEERGKWLRVIMLPDGTVHNAFFDRRFIP